MLRPVLTWWRAREVLARDAVGALAFTALAFAPGLAPNGLELGDLPARPLDALGVVVLFAQSLPLALRRRWPVLALGLIAVAWAVQELRQYPLTFASIGLLLVLYAAGEYQERWRREVVAVATVGFAVLAFALHQHGSKEGLSDALAFYFVLAVFWTGGRLMRDRAAAEAERRHRGAEEAVAAERAAIARDLHDVVTHSVTAMVVQADAAGFLLDGAPAKAGENITSISATGRRALTELRALLHVLDGNPDAGRVPAVGELAELVEQARAVGQPVQFNRRGEPKPLAGGVELAAYRVVQEALTNAVKHAPGRRTVVRVTHREEAVEVAVETAPGPVVEPVGGSSGRGLVGLRERVAGLGGEFTAAPDSDGVFAVRARIPAAQP